MILILGGVRSGKSRAALAYAAAAPGTGRSVFVATGEAHDDEMARRIVVHQRERGEGWETLEAPVDVAAAIDRRLSGGEQPASIVIDCLTLWVSNILLKLDESDDAEAVLAERTAELLAVVARHSSIAWIVVSNEVGLGVVPATSLGRRYRDALGRTNQLVAAAADRVELMVAGLSMVLKGG